MVSNTDEITDEFFVKALIIGISLIIFGLSGFYTVVSLGVVQLSIEVQEMQPREIKPRIFRGYSKEEEALLRKPSRPTDKRSTTRFSPESISTKDAETSVLVGDQNISDINAVLEPFSTSPRQIDQMNLRDQDIASAREIPDEEEEGQQNPDELM